MIIEETLSVLTLVPPRQLPRSLTRLSYLSLAVATFICVLSLINVARDPELSIPNAVAFALTAPYNLTTAFVARKHRRHPNITPVLSPTTWKGLVYSCLLVGLWIYGLVVDIIQLSNSLGPLVCDQWGDDDDTPCGRRARSMTMPFFIVLTFLGGIQVILIAVTVIICAHEKRQQMLASRARHSEK
ncbi:hypothetical protein D9615_004758 [Tricholomella constricta]|uniref:Uncharacterized protein n=1 Tax=Tricholomella constricta TaxID=117010 RepID=A0A8H5HCB0_9AGAR|nr:hypothetical protein D9615_004758 [Tricholomella constricta]